MEVASTQELFECSECDFKTVSEAKMINHSVTHQCMDEEESGSLNGVNSNDSARNSHSFTYKKEEMDDVSLDGSSQESKYWNTDIKVEDIEVAQDVDSYISPRYVNRSDAIEQQSKALPLSQTFSDFKNLVAFGHKQLWRPPAANRPHVLIK